MFFALNKVMREAVGSQAPLPGAHIDRLRLARLLKGTPGKFAPCSAPCLDCGWTGLTVVQLAGFFAQGAAITATTGDDNMRMDIPFIAMRIRRMDDPRAGDAMPRIEVMAPIAS